MTKYQIITGELYEVEAETEREALANFANGQFVETLTQVWEHTCPTCPPDTYGWHAEDNAGITFGSLKRSQNEAFRQGIAWAVAWLAREEQNEFAEFLEADAKDLEGPYNEGCEVACQ